MNLFFSNYIITILIFVDLLTWIYNKCKTIFINSYIYTLHFLKFIFNIITKIYKLILYIYE